MTEYIRRTQRSVCYAGLGFKSSRKMQWLSWPNGSSPKLYGLC